MMDKNSISILKFFALIALLQFLLFLFVMVPNKTWHLLG